MISTGPATRRRSPSGAAGGRSAGSPRSTGRSPRRSRPPASRPSSQRRCRPSAGVRVRGAARPGRSSAPAARCRRRVRAAGTPLTRTPWATNRPSSAAKMPRQRWVSPPPVQCVDHHRARRGVPDGQPERPGAHPGEERRHQAQRQQRGEPAHRVRRMGEPGPAVDRGDRSRAAAGSSRSGVPSQCTCSIGAQKQRVVVRRGRRRRTRRGRGADVRGWRTGTRRGTASTGAPVVGSSRRTVGGGGSAGRRAPGRRRGGRRAASADPAPAVGGPVRRGGPGRSARLGRGRAARSTRSRAGPLVCPSRRPLDTAVGPGSVVPWQSELRVGAVGSQFRSDRRDGPGRCRRGAPYWFAGAPTRVTRLAGHESRSRRGRLALRQRPAPHRPRLRLRRSLRRLRPVHADGRPRRAHGLRHRRARHPDPGAGRRRGGHPARAGRPVQPGDRRGPARRSGCRTTCSPAPPPATTTRWCRSCSPGCTATATSSRRPPWARSPRPPAAPCPTATSRAPARSAGTTAPAATSATTAATSSTRST